MRTITVTDATTRTAVIAGTATYSVSLNHTFGPLVDQLTAYAGGHAGDYDLAAAAAEYAAALDALAEELGWTWWGRHCNVLSTPADVTRLDVLFELEEIDLRGIMQRHYRTA